jgi:hypothetical protein
MLGFNRAQYLIGLFMPRYRLITIAALGALALAAPLQAAQDPNTAIKDMVPRGLVLGAGADSCAVWTQKRAAGAGWHEHAQWINGYLTSQAQQLYIVTQLDILAQQNIDGFSVLPQLDAYCAANPQSRMIYAAQEILGIAYRDMTAKSANPSKK